jgi:hypothetical protein|tara:strand:+ start:373 stop:549 length:177 start_codon:yes stop_codon:yes gene_type:complete
MKNFSVTGKWTQPYTTHTLLWQHIENNETLEELDFLETQMRTTALAEKLLNNIGVKCK